ncbi:MAG: RNA polymerase sigma factor [Thermoanaerobaculaceae bacterium]
MKRSASATVEWDVHPLHGAPDTPPDSSGDAFYKTFLAPMEARMLRAVWRVVRDPDRSRDALQEALATIWRKRDRIRTHPNPEALVLRICLDAALDALRKARRSSRHLELVPGPLPELPTPAGPAEVAQERELRDQVREAIARLPGKQAVAVLMRVVQEEDYPAIAAALGCAQATARVHVMRGRARLERLLAHLVPGGRKPGGAE